MLLLALGVLAGCRRIEDIQQNPLLGTCKLVGFGNTADNTFREAEPKDCEQCYTITFREDGTFFGYTSTNEVGGRYIVETTAQKIEFINFGGTKINELPDGHVYADAFNSVNLFEINSNKLRLYYNNGLNFLLFNPK